MGKHNLHTLEAKRQRSKRRKLKKLRGKGTDDGPAREGRVEKNTNSKSSRANSKQQRCMKTSTAKQESESQGTVVRLQNNAEIQQSETKKIKEES